MEPMLLPNDKQLFYKYLDSATTYFEFGSGGSTFQAAQRENIKAIYSVESDSQWTAKLKAALADKSNINYICINMKTAPNALGYPGRGSTLEDWKKYSDSIVILDAGLREKVDLVLIDGRFRVACALKCFDTISDSCVVIFDDFLNRPHYNVVLNYYEIVEKTADKVLVVLKKKAVASPTRDLIESYEGVAG